MKKRQIRETRIASERALTSGSMTPQQLLSQAFSQPAQNPEKIGELNMSPEVLRELIKS